MGCVSSLRILTYLKKIFFLKNKICESSLRILSHKFCLSDFEKWSEKYENDISSLRILISSVFGFFFAFWKF